MNIAEILRGIKRPLEDDTRYKFRTGKGSVKYLIIPSQDGQMDPITHQWGSSVEVIREDDGLFAMFKDKFTDRVVDIPASLHLKNQSVDWTKVDLLPDAKNPLKYKVVLTGED